ncbi:hypothetical protein P7C70_g5818, partial [Phenoliferia sp. Uapishka_3]
APLPPRSLPPNPSRQVSCPHPGAFHPGYFFELRDTKLANGAKSFSLLWPQLKQVLQDPALHSVTYSKKFGPGGRNAFLSYAPHFWPDSKELDAYLQAHPGATSDEWEDKIKWDHKDANRNADTGNASQAKELQTVCNKVFILAMGQWLRSSSQHLLSLTPIAAYHFGLKFNPSVCKPASEKAFQLLWTFFGDPATRMIPEVAYGQYVRGSQPKGKYRPEGLLHVSPTFAIPKLRDLTKANLQIRGLILISQILPLLPAPPSPFSPHPFMHPWFEAHVDFLQNHECGKLAATRRNNIGTHYFCQLATHLITINRPLEAHAVVTNMFMLSPANPQGISAKISPTTSALVQEIKRPNPLHYTLFELEPLCFLAELANSIRVYNNLPQLPDVWLAENHALKRAVDFGIFYMLKSIGCEEPRGMRLPDGVKEPEKNEDLRGIVYMARAAAVRYGRGEYEWLVGQGVDGEMEPRNKDEAKGWQGRIQPLQGWNASGRWKWAMLEGF